MSNLAIFLDRNEPSNSGSGKILFIGETRFSVSPRPELTTAHLTEVQAVPGSKGSMLNLVFSDHGRYLLQQLSLDHRGAWLVVVVDDEAIAAVEMNSIIQDGALTVNTNLTDEELEVKVTQLQTQVNKLQKW